MQPVNSIPIPKELVIFTVIVSSTHVISLIICLLCLGKRPFESCLTDSAVFNLLQSLTYATLKTNFDFLALGVTYFGILPDRFPVLLGASMVVALVAEVMHILLPPLILTICRLNSDSVVHSERQVLP
jgi:hypothetical protein